MEFPDWTVAGERMRDYLFHVMPSAGFALYEFVKEWQTLIAGVLVILAARYFFEAMLKSSRLMAEAVIHSARIAGDLEKGTQRESPPSRAALAPQPMLGVPAPGHPPAGTSLGGRLDALRDAVRSALAAIPTNGNDIGLKGAALYGRVATFTFDDVDPAPFDQGALATFRELQTCLDALRLDSNKVSDARQAWERLVRINKLARELRGKVPSEGAAPLEKTIVKKIG